MFPRIRLILKYFRYLLVAKTKHGVHSPFVYDLLTNIILDDRSFYAYEHIENHRRALFLDKKIVEVTDFGAGSQKGNSKKKTVAHIAKHAAKPSKYSQLLFRLVAHYKPANMLEL